MPSLALRAPGGCLVGCIQWNAFGGPRKRAEFMMSEMKQGMDKIQMIEDSVPMLAALG